MNEQNIKKEDLTDDEITEQRFNALPKVIQDAILNSGWQNIVRNLVKQYKLRIDQGNELENTVFGLMLGMFDSEELFDFIMNDLNLGEENAKKLFSEIDEKIFNDIYRNVMKSGVYSDQLGANNKTEDKSLSKENYVREDIENAAKDDEILTVTREELLKGIEKPDEIKNESEKAPDLSKSNVMPINQQSMVNSQQSSTGAKDLVEAPVNLPSGNDVPQKENYVEDKPVDPIEAGLSSSVSTSNKGYKEKDPYREPLE